MDDDRNMSLSTIPVSDSFIGRKQSLLDQFLKKGRGAPKKHRSEIFARAVKRNDPSRRKGREQETCNDDFCVGTATRYSYRNK